MTKIVLLTQSEAAEYISMIGKTAKTLQADIHQTAVSVLAHTKEHGDYRGVLSLLAALPNGQRVQALGVWFGHFSNGALKCEKKAGQWVVVFDSKLVDKIDVELAGETDFGTLTKETKPAAMTMEKLIKWLENKATANDDEVEPAAKAVAKMLVTDYKEFVAKKLAAA